MKIDGARILLTGASGGLGRAIATELAGRGAELTVTSRRRVVLEDLAAETGAEVVVADLTDRADVDALCGRIADFDGIVLNAGQGDRASLLELTADDIDFLVDLNLRSNVLMAVRYAQDRIASSRPGNVVTIGSLSGVVATPGTRLYNATKFGLRGFSLSLRQDLAGYGIGVCHVAPGFIRDAGMFAEGGADVPGYVRTKAPADVAAAVVKGLTDCPPEVVAALVELRAVSSLGGLSPWLSEIVQRGIGTAGMTGT